MDWKTIERPGYFGRKRDDVIKLYDLAHGRNNWRIAWSWQDKFVGFEFACNLYEDGYYQDSFKREDLWKKLTKEAGNVYDFEENDIFSGFDYRYQKAKATHLQDIAIRRVVSRRGWKFSGDKLVRIRGGDGWGEYLSPGKVPFHLPEHIDTEYEENCDVICKLADRREPWTLWWDKHSIEDFYQSNKVVQVRVAENINPGEILEIIKETEQKQASQQIEIYDLKEFLLKTISGEPYNLKTKINKRIAGQAPLVTGIKMNTGHTELEIDLDCEYEWLGGEHGDLIESVAAEELKLIGLEKLKSHIPHYYYGK